MDPVADIFCSHPVLRVSRMLKKVPLAAKPKRATLMTMKDKWFHWLTENTRVRSTSIAREDSDNKKTALKIMVDPSTQITSFQGPDPSSVQIEHR